MSVLVCHVCRYSYWLLLRDWLFRDCGRLFELCRGALPLVFAFVRPADPLLFEPLRGVPLVGLAAARPEPLPCVPVRGAPLLDEVAPGRPPPLRCD